MIAHNGYKNLVGGFGDTRKPTAPLPIGQTVVHQVTYDRVALSRRETLRRRIKDGRGSSRINGQAVTAATLKAVSSLLIDLHGQHEREGVSGPDGQWRQCGCL